MRNIGDSLNAPLHWLITGREMTRKTRRQVLGCGTILHGIKGNRGHEVWGSGWNGRSDLSKRPEPKIHAVRGPMTRAACLIWGWDCPAVYGDPAILLPLLISHPRVTEGPTIGYIPHFKSERWTLPGCVTISPRTKDILYFIQVLNCCSVIMSESLHGLILADTYGIPSVWVPRESKRKNPLPPTWEFKYHDYYASIGVEREPSMNPDDAQLNPIPEGMADKLLEVCPWE